MDSFLWAVNDTGKLERHSLVRKLFMPCFSWMLVLFSVLLAMPTAQAERRLVTLSGEERGF